MVFYLFSMSFLLFISVLNNSPESSKRRDLYIFCFQQQSQQFLLWECVYNVHTLEWNVCNNHQGAYIHSNKISLFSLMCLFSFYSNVEYFCVPFKVRGSYLFWAVEIYIFCRSQAQRILMIPYYYYFFILNFFSVVILHENRTAHALNIKHGQTNAQTICEYHARKSSIEHHLHMIPKCHNLNRFIYKIQFVCETDQKPGAHITLLRKEKKST